MDAPFLLRPATPADCARLAELERECFTDPWSEGGMREVLALPGGYGLVAEFGGVVVAYLLARSVADTAEILNLAVSPARRREGLASALLRRGLADLRAWGVAEVFLEVRQSNLAAQALYREHGFRVAGMRRAYYRKPVEDALLLRLELESVA